MKRIILIGLCISLLFVVGCQKKAVEPYALTKEAKEALSEEEQTFYVDFVKSCIADIEIMRNSESTYEEGLEALQTTYKMVPGGWSWDRIDSITDESISFFLQMMDCYMGCRNYTNYADCKDAVEAIAEKMADLFINKEDIREALTLSETRFKEIYDRGKKNQ